jgi:hypothetical protein
MDAPTPEDMARDLEFDLAFLGNDVTPDNALRRIGRAAVRRALRAEGLNAELLAACEDMLPLLENAYKCEANADDGNGHPLRELRRRYDAARAAVAKAKGA